MTRTLLASALLASTSTAALAGGLDRTGLPLDLLFEEGNYIELGYAHTTPNISGEGTGNTALGPIIPPGTNYVGVGDDFGNFSAGVKLDLNEQWSVALQFEQPFGSDIIYNGDPASTELGGTTAIAETEALTAIVRYKFDDNWSVHGGLRVQQARGNIELGGLAYGAPVPAGTPAFAGGFNGYRVELETNTATGWLAGVAYEIPEIALRVALTYNSEITHDFDTTEFYAGAAIGEGETEVEVPRSVNLDFQTGIAEDTLLFGSFRWAEWSEFKIDPELFTAAANGGLVDLQDSRTVELGVARRFTEEFAGSAAFTWEETNSDDLVSPLAPTNGLFAVSLGGAYDVTENVVLSGGVRYSWLGNARPETGTPDTARAEFEDNRAVTVGFSVGYRF
ncbi:MAG: outer membrane protein transport protein [Pseudomonadota bacterium]